MHSDDLAILLFWLTLSAAFGVEVVKAETFARRLGFGFFAALFLASGIFWQQLSTLWPPLTASVTRVATHPVSWFVLFIFLAAIFAFHRPKAKADTSRTQAIINGRNWLTSYEFLELADDTLVQARKDRLAERAILQEQMTKLGNEYNALMLRNPPDANGMRPPIPELASLETQRDGLLSELQENQRQADHIFVQMQNSVHTRLQSGQLVAKGFLMPVTAASVETPIPREQWRFLRFQDGFKKAGGEGISYTGLAVAKN
jgi:hypothetical protein